MQNLILEALTNDKGQLDVEKVSTAIPDKMSTNLATRHILELLSKTKLDEAFIKDYFVTLPLDTLLMYNDIPEEIIMDNLIHVFKDISVDLTDDADVDTLQLFLSKGYSPETYDLFIGKLFKLITTVPVSEPTVEAFTTTINAFNEVVSKQFILDNLSDIGYLLLTSALKRGDFTHAELLDNTNQIPLEEIITWLWEFDDVDQYSTDRLYNYNNKILLFQLLKTKAEHQDSF